MIRGWRWKKHKGRSAIWELNKILQHVRKRTRCTNARQTFCRVMFPSLKIGELKLLISGRFSARPNYARCGKTAPEVLLQNWGAKNGTLWLSSSRQNYTGWSTKNKARFLLTFRKRMQIKPSTLSPGCPETPKDSKLAMASRRAALSDNTSLIATNFYLNVTTLRSDLRYRISQIRSLCLSSVCNLRAPILWGLIGTFSSLVLFRSYQASIDCCPWGGEKNLSLLTAESAVSAAATSASVNAPLPAHAKEVKNAVASLRPCWWHSAVLRQPLHRLARPGCFHGVRNAGSL